MPSLTSADAYPTWHAGLTWTKILVEGITETTERPADSRTSPTFFRYFTPASIVYFKVRDRRFYLTRRASPRGIHLNVVLCVGVDNKHNHHTALRRDE